jgi:hypothetical protein
MTVAARLRRSRLGGLAIRSALGVAVAAAGWWVVAHGPTPSDRRVYPRCAVTRYAIEVQECWREGGRSVYRVSAAHGAHRAIVVEIEISDLTDSLVVARELVPGITMPVDEVMLYFREAGRPDGRVRIRWTRTHGYEILAF